MDRRWVADASPIIVLARIGQAQLLEDLSARLVVPQAVADEIEAGPEADPARIWLAGRTSIESVPVAVSENITEWGLGAGESAAISFALQERGFEVILDDAAGRACAEASGVRVRGTLGVLLMARKAGQIQSIRPELEALKEAGMWIDDALYRKVLVLAGETAR